MHQKIILGGAIGFGMAIVGVAAFLYVSSSGQDDFLASPQGLIQGAGDSENELFPPRSQEEIAEPEEKDTSFERANEVKSINCTDFYCFEEYYQALVATVDPQAAFTDLKVRYDKAALVRSYCHPLSHVIGRAAVEKYPAIAEAYAKGDHFCWSGYYHGVMEAILYKTTPEELPVTINAICENIPGKATYSFDYYNCVHGLGHGVMYITQNELFDALELCNYLDGGWEKESCYGGVFMENVITDFENHFTEYLRPEDPMYPCNAVKEQYKHACYLMQTSYALKENGYNFGEVFDLCSQVEEQHKNTCYQSLGRDASGSTVSSVEPTKARCMLGKDFRQQSNCVIGAVRDFISYFHSDKQAKQLCAALSPEFGQLCLDTATTYYKSFSKDS